MYDELRLSVDLKLSLSRFSYAIRLSINLRLLHTSLWHVAILKYCHHFFFLPIPQAQTILRVLL